MNNTKPGHEIPWLTILLVGAAITSFLASSSENILLFIPVIRFLPLVVLAAIACFFWGLVKYLTHTDPVVRNSGVHILLWGLLATVVTIILWGTAQTMQATFGVQGNSSINAALPTSPAQPPMRYAPGEAPMMQESGGIASKATADMQAIVPYPYPDSYPYYGGTPNANDTREFNKISYNATMQTRDVPGLTKLVETTVRGNGGRTDQVNSSEKSGYVRFVVPKDKFDDFRNQIESFVDWRFLSVNIDSQNMLPQKQSIEQQQDYTNMNLDQLNAAKKTENSDYAKKKASIQSQIDANDREFAMLSTSLQTADEATRPNIVSRQMDLSSQTSALRTRLAALEQTHLNTINSIEAQIRYANGTKDTLNKQDQNLMDNVATVSGTISIRWISLWEIAHAYLPGFWIPGILLALAALAHWWHRRKVVVA